MKGFCYAAALQFRLDIRSKALLITCYLVPLLFFGLMGGIFTSLDPNAKSTLLPSMTVMGVSMGAVWHPGEKDVSSRGRPPVYGCCHHRPLRLCPPDDPGRNPLSGSAFGF